MLWQLCTENDLSFLFFPLKVTASGDQTAKVWDVRAGELLGICKGHQCSLKSVAFSRFEKGKCWYSLLSVFSFFFTPGKVLLRAEKGLWKLMDTNSTGLSSDPASKAKLSSWNLMVS